MSLASPDDKGVEVTDLSYNHDARLLSVTFATEEKFDIPAELLRVESPSAEVQGHGKGEKKIIPRRPKVSIMLIEPVGNYAVKLIFDDLHDTGFYTWETLYRLGSQQKEIWAEYLVNVDNLFSRT